MTSDDALRQAAQAAWTTRLDAPVAHLLEDVLSEGGAAGSRWLTFSGPDGPLTVRLDTAADGVVSIRVEMPSAADAVELWGPDGRLIALHQLDGGWVADVDASGPTRVLCMRQQESSTSVFLQTEWFALL